MTSDSTPESSLDDFEFSFPSEEAKAVRDAYESASIILEYGSGGSTVFAASLAGKQIFTVESDCYWTARLQKYLADNKLPSRAMVYHVDIGPTGAWGRPLSEISWRSFYHYPMKIWDEPNFIHPDVILIDGRFRSACFLYACMKIQKPVTILFDDYVHRPSYSVVEKFVKPSRIVGRLAIFHVEPNSCGVQEIPHLIQELNSTLVLNDETKEHSPYSTVNSNTYSTQNESTKDWLQIPEYRSQIKKLQLEHENSEKKIALMARQEDQLRQQNASLLESQKEIELLRQKYQSADASLKAATQQTENLNANLLKSQKEIELLRQKYQSADASLKAAKQQNRHLTSKLEEQAKGITHIQKAHQEKLNIVHQIIKSAQDWQKRSWVKRAFHKWRTPKKLESKLKNLKNSPKPIKLPALKSEIVEAKPVAKSETFQILTRIQKNQTEQGSRYKPSKNSGKPPLLDANHQKLKFNLTTCGLEEISLRTLTENTSSDSKKRKAQSAWILLNHYLNSCDDEFLTKEKVYHLLDLIDGNDEFRERLGSYRTVFFAEALRTCGCSEEAVNLLANSLKQNTQTDLLVSTLWSVTQLEDKLTILNEVLKISHLSPVKLDSHSDAPTLFDKITDTYTISPHSPTESDSPLITVVMPVHNGESTILAALTSIQRQSYTNLEIIVVDDNSSDSTVTTIEKVMQQDSRIKVIRLEECKGAYVSRNTGLAAAKGKYITCHDADDWSHPDKLKIQVEHLLENEHVIANTSQILRLDENLCPDRYGSYGHYIQLNSSSLLFNREKVLNKVGYWDSVRFGADSEYIERIKLAFGKESVVSLPTGPVSFVRKSSGSLTASKKNGYRGHLLGSRYLYWTFAQNHARKGKHLKYDFPQSHRPFTVPYQMRTDLDLTEIKKTRKLDVVIASDFRFPGGNCTANLADIEANISLNLTTGLIQLFVREFGSEITIDSRIIDGVDGEKVQMLAYGEEIETDLLIVRHPRCIQYPQNFVPNVKAKKTVVIVNQTPMTSYGDSDDAVEVYDLMSVRDNVKTMFHSTPEFFTVGPLIRETLEKHHSNHLQEIGGLSDEFWVEIINVKSWSKQEILPPNEDCINVCRHSRDHFLKWPADRESITQCYPDQYPFQVNVLGGAESIQEKFEGVFPANWQILKFGEMHPKEFLQRQDFYVYFPHPDLVEAFGRGILEALAVGLVVILPASFQPLFKEAAVYCEAHEVQETILKYTKDSELYIQQATLALEFSEKEFGFSKHRERLSQMI